MTTQERLKHASEVLGWLADGKKVQYLHSGEWQDTFGSVSVIAEKILCDGWRYRVKPEPVEFNGIVRRNGETGQVFVPIGLAFEPGDRVRVTKLEDGQ